MRKTLLFLVFSVVAGAAQAQIKCWTGADGKRACGDAPPAGAKAALRPLESGQRVARTNAQGERYFLDDAQVAQELASTRKVAQDACGS